MKQSWQPFIAFELVDLVPSSVLTTIFSMAAVQSEKVKGLGPAAASLNLLLCQDMMASRACYCVDSLIMVDVGVKPFRTFFWVQWEPTECALFAF
jgi:hypothetical protein